MQLKLENKHLVFIAILAGLFILLFADQQTYDVLRFSRMEILTGEVWRMFFGHLVHLNIYHGLLNITALIMIVVSLGDMLSVCCWLTYSVILCFFISLGLLIFSSHVVTYVGLSGVLHGIFSLLVILYVVRESRFYAILLVGLLVKIVNEQLPGFDIYHMAAFIDGAVIVDGHLYGAIGGVMLAFVHLVLIPRMNFKAREL